MAIDATGREGRPSQRTLQLHNDAAVVPMDAATHRHVEEDGRSSNDDKDVGGMRKVEAATSRSEMQDQKEEREREREREREGEGGRERKRELKRAGGRGRI